jgi:hypothetical protein
MIPRLSLCCVALALVLSGPVLADPTPFDLAGPTLEVQVTSAGKTLPIAEAPNLTAGDQLSIKADLPPDQSVRYVLVTAFLRGATNPPPKTWFSRAETWTGKRDGVLKVTVPMGAEQALVFLAPETGGDFPTVVNAVRDRPGAFVRAAQDLNRASLDRSRLDAFLAAVRRIGQADPDRLKAVSPLLARSLGIKLNADCLEKASELEASCLMQPKDLQVLNDEHSTSIVEALTSDTSAGLVAQLSSTPHAGLAYYSPYVGSVMDIARMLDSFHTAHYQYVPALTTGQDDRLSLLLNTPPSFQDPKSVLVVALPMIEAAQPPPLRPVDANQAFCTRGKDLVLPVEGAPLAFSTHYAHDMALRVTARDGKPIELPVTADAEKGGFVVDTANLASADLGDAPRGLLHGEWGFAPYSGPEFRLAGAHGERWRLVADDRQSLVAGGDGVVRLQAPDAACVESIALQRAAAKPEPVDWKLTQPDEVSVDMPLKRAKPGALALSIKTYGADADVVPLEALSQPSHIDSFTVHAGDPSAVLKGVGLDQVKGVSLGAISYAPDPAGSSVGDELSLAATDVDDLGKLSAGDSATAVVSLKDGRTVSLDVTVGAPRPRVTLIGKSVQPSASAAPSTIQLADPDAIPPNAQLTFSIRAERPASFSGDEKVEVATASGVFSTTLTLADGLTLEDSQVALATLDTGKRFSSSAAGPLRFRIVVGDVAGGWQPLATLVRMPQFGDLKCPARIDQPCRLSGSNLFLLNAISNSPDFGHPIQVPEGFPGQVLSVPHPKAGRLYVKLHDDPAVIDEVTLPTGRSPAIGARPPASSKPAVKS